MCSKMPWSYFPLFPLTLKAGFSQVMLYFIHSSGEENTDSCFLTWGLHALLSYKLLSVQHFCFVVVFNKVQYVSWMEIGPDERVGSCTTVALKKKSYCAERCLKLLWNSKPFPGFVMHDLDSPNTGALSVLPVAMWKCLLCLGRTPHSLLSLPPPIHPLPSCGGSGVKEFNENCISISRMRNYQT